MLIFGTNEVDVQNLEPYFNWRDEYIASEDEISPFFGIVYNELYYDKKLYNFLLHPQWDDFGSDTLYLKILFCHYELGFTVIEMIGEWNDAINNDIMILKRELIDLMVDAGIHKFILIGENILNFHASDDSYYEEWFQDIEDGWIVGINFREHVIHEFENNNIDYYLNFGGVLDDLNWRTFKPTPLFHLVEQMIQKRLN